MLTCQVLLWWPPKRAEHAQQASAEQAGESKKITEETFSPETAKLLVGLGNKQPSGPEVEPVKLGTVQASLQSSTQPSHCFQFVTQLLVRFWSGANM